MKNNYNLFHPYYLLKKHYAALFYREHIPFFLNLLKFIIIKKQFFLINQNIFFDFILKHFSDYNKIQYYKKESYNFFLSIIFNIKNIKKQKNYNLFSYLTSFIGAILYFGHYNISTLSIAQYNEEDKKNIIILIEQLLATYKYTPKIIFITRNQQLEKGIVFKYKDFNIDLSLKKLYELLNKKITINNIGEL